MSSDTLFIFGDQSAELLPSIQELHRRSKQCEPLRSFLRAATDKVQQALARAPAHVRPRCPPFDSTLQLVEAVETEWGCAALVSALLSISQLGNLILHLSNNPRALESTSNPAFFGICSGSIAAAAAASSRNITELLYVALQIVTLAFQLGLEASKRSWLLEKSDESWATLVINVKLDEVREALAVFNSVNGESHGNQIYVSATGGNSVTLSGPPSTSKKLFENVNLFRDAKIYQFPIRAAFHASHLTQVPQARIFNYVDEAMLKRPMQHVLVSPNTGKPYESEKLEGVLHEITQEILQLPIRWQTATSELSKVLSHSVALYPMGPVGAIKAIRQALSTHELHERTSPPSVPEDTTARSGSGAVAIVGMSVRLPGSETLDEFWKVLEEGQDLHEKIRADRFDWKTHCDPTGKIKNTTLTPYGVFIDRPGYFDARFFNMSPREAAQTDPQQRLMLLTTYEALEHAGYSPNRTPATNTRRIASFIGQTGDDYREVNASQDIDTYFITGGIRAFGPGRVNYHFGWEGPSFSLDTACSSSAGSIQLAASALLARECDTAVGGGANLLTTPDLFAGLSRGSFLSKTGGCKTFDHDADGYVRADGCGVVVMKRLEDAIADRDNILAVVRGAITNHSAEAVSITHPHDMTQQRLFKAVLNEAGILPTDVDYAELHGTGTQAGDATESRSVTSVLCQGRDSSNPLYIGTVKPNLGHAEAASGVTSVIKAILMLQRNMIPPHVGIKGRMNQKLPPLNQLNARISFGKTPFLPRSNGDGKRRILVNNFDAAGGNTSLLLEDPPDFVVEGADTRNHQIIALSAKSSTAMENNVRRLLVYLRDDPEVRLEDVAYTTTARRIHHNVRKAYTVTSIKELVTTLEKQLSSNRPVSRVPTGARAVFCFTGQGSQYVSMGLSLYEVQPVFKELIDDYDAICTGHGFASFLPIINGDSTALQSPVQTQLAIIAIELAVAFLWQSLGVRPIAVIGHSVGEYAAMCCAGILSPSDCFYLIGKRASLMVEKCIPGTHAMLAVQATTDTLQEMLDQPDFSTCELACLNAPTSLSVSGISEQINNLMEKLQVEGIKATRLDVPFAFHSSQLDNMLDDYAHIAEKVQFGKPTIPIASTLLGEIVTADDIFDSQYVRLQARNPVMFQDAIQALRDGNIINEKTVFIETGPSPICLGMVKAILGDNIAVLPTLKRNEADWKIFTNAVAGAYASGLDVNWSEYHRPFESALRMLQLPNYAFDLKNYWIQYEGDWALRKGLTGPVSDQSESPPKPVSSFSTSSLHRVDKQSIEEDEILVSFSSEAAESALNGALSGHQVNGAALCPSSVYAEMAFSAARYVHELAGNSSQLCLDVCNMNVHKPLIIKPNTQQIILVTASLKRKSKEIHVNYSSRDGKDLSDHANCLVRAGVAENLQSEWSRHAYLVQHRMDYLVQASHTGKVHKILRPMAYKLFAALVDYSSNYRGMETVYLDSDLYEASANIKFQTDNGNFAHNPYWIDTIAHLSGFVLNGSDSTPTDSVFISHGWGSMKFFTALSAEKHYRSYVRMRPTKTKGVMAGDVYLFENEEVVGVIENLKFQQIKRNVLNRLLPSSIPVQALPQKVETPKSSSGPVPKTAHKPKAIAKSNSVPTAIPTSAPVSTPAITAARNKKGGVEFAQVLDIIAQEVGVDMPELEDEDDFTDLGVDSLLTISILTNLNQVLDQELPASLFIEYPTIKELRAFFNSRNDTSTASENRPSQAKVARPVTQPRKSSTFKSKKTVSVSTDFEKVLEVIAAEVGTDVDELDDDTEFTDLGVDSLLTISILTNLGQQMGQNFPASIFMEHPTVGDLRNFYRGMTGHATTAFQQPVSDVSDASENGSSSEYDVLSGNDTPGTPISDYGSSGAFPSKFDSAEMMRKIIAQEVGISPQEIEPDLELSELGVDSLLSLSILTRIKDQMGMAIPSTFFIENPTFAHIQRALGETLQKVATGQAVMIPRHPKAQASTWKASSILLQGSSSSRNPCLFLIPDGSGSASSYVGLPPMHLRGPVYGLNSPFLSNPADLTGSLQDVVSYYIDEIKRVQPEGPYYLGGWSVGGIFAYEAASQLLNRHDDEVAALLLIDAPCPTLYPPLPMDTITFLTSIGAFDSLKPNPKRRGAPSTDNAQGMREGVQEHFRGSLNALRQYQAVPLQESNSVKEVIAMWAEHGVWQTVGTQVRESRELSMGEKNAATDWIMDLRTDYGPGAWEMLLPGAKFTCELVKGDHFSMMKRPVVADLAQKIGAALTHE